MPSSCASNATRSNVPNCSPGCMPRAIRCRPCSIGLGAESRRRMASAFVCNSSHALVYRPRFGWPAELIRRHDHTQFRDRRGPQGVRQPANRAVAARLQMGQMMRHQRHHAFLDLVRRIEARQKSFRQRPALFLMARRNDPPPPVALGFMRGLRFGEVMCQHGEHEHPAGRLVRLAPLGQFHQCVATMAGVREHVAFRMPLRILRCSVQCRDLREVPQPAGLLQEAQSGRRPRDSSPT